MANSSKIQLPCLCLVALQFLIIHGPYGSSVRTMASASQNHVPQVRLLKITDSGVSVVKDRMQDVGAGVIRRSGFGFRDHMPSPMAQQQFSPHQSFFASDRQDAAAADQAAVCGAIQTARDNCPLTPANAEATCQALNAVLGANQPCGADDAEIAAKPQDIRDACDALRDALAPTTGCTAPADDIAMTTLCDVTNQADVTAFCPLAGPPPQPPLPMLPPAGGMMPPAGGMMPPAGGMMPPAGGMMPPAGGMMPPAGGMMPPAGGMMPPAGGMSGAGAGNSGPGAGGPGAGGPGGSGPGGGGPSGMNPSGAGDSGISGSGSLGPAHDMASMLSQMRQEMLSTEPDSCAETTEDSCCAATTECRPSNVC